MVPTAGIPSGRASASSIPPIRTACTSCTCTGLFYNFPKTFSSANFAGLTPISSYYKMPVDYCMFNGQLVMGKNDTTKFSNALVPKAESNLWFGQLADLQTWGAPTGHGAVWMNEAVTAGPVSDPFLVSGFSQAHAPPPQPRRVRRERGNPDQPRHSRLDPRAQRQRPRRRLCV